jgi:ABC-type multidrug transport system fused ATPase/permease subunit
MMFWNFIVKDSVRIYKVLPRRLRLSYWVVFFLQVTTAITETLTLVVLSLFAISVASPEAAMNHFLVRPVLEALPKLNELLSSPTRMVGFTSAFMIFFVCLKTILSAITNYLTYAYSERISIYITRENVKRYLSKPYFWHISAESSGFTEKIFQRLELAHLTLQLLSLYANIICSFFLFTSLFIAQPKLTLVVIACFAGSSLLLYSLIKQGLDKAAQAYAETSVEEQMTLTAMSQGIREIITYNQQGTALNKISQALEKGHKPRSFAAFSPTIPALVMESVGFSTIGGLVIYMLWRHIPMEQIVAAASMLMLTAWRILPIVTRSLAYSVMIRASKPRAMLSLELLENFIKENPAAPALPDPNFKFSKSLSLKEASFGYPDSDQIIIEKVNMTIEKGQNIGLIGPSGAGKSTLALLLSGLVAPTSGLFEVDGQVLGPSALAAYLLKLGYVPQNPLLIDGTLADNVAFSKWGDDYDREKVLQACKLAALDFVVNYPENLQMKLAGPSGRALSGGEAQRVAIARALFAGPEIIIFDEATSALDQANENVIRNTISRVKGQITTIIIAHRLSTVEDCDLIYWLEDGQIKAQGRPSEIIPKYQGSFKAAQEEKAQPTGQLA